MAFWKQLRSLPCSYEAYKCHVKLRREGRAEEYTGGLYMGYQGESLDGYVLPTAASLYGRTRSSINYYTCEERERLWNRMLSLSLISGHSAFSLSCPSCPQHTESKHSFWSSIVIFSYPFSKVSVQIHIL